MRTRVCLDRDRAALAVAVLVHFERNEAAFLVERVQKGQITGTANSRAATSRAVFAGVVIALA